MKNQLRNIAIGISITLSFAAAAQCSGPNTLNTALAGGNGLDGIMFDLTASSSITVECFDVSFGNGTQTENFEIWTRLGTHVGFEGSTNGWSLIGSAMATSAGSGAATNIPIAVGTAMNSGDTRAFYITVVNGSTNVDYTNGTAVGNVLASDANLEILEGTGVAYPTGGSTFAPRNFNGNVHYSTGGGGFSCSAPNSLTTPLMAGNGNNGIMFDVDATSNVTIECIDLLCNSGTHDIEVWTKSGTHVGSETTSADWTQIGTASNVVSNGTTPVSIPLSINTPIAAMFTQAFYITISSGDNLDYTNGTAVGNVLASDAAISILEGTGLNYPFGNGVSVNTARNFNGILHYSDNGTGGSPCTTSSGLTTNYAGGNGFDGVMFDITSLSNTITVQCFESNFDAGTLDLEIYTKSGTHVGFGTDQAAWTLVGSASGVTSAGDGNPTYIPINVGVSIPAGSTQAFHVTTTSTSGAQINYTDGSATGSVLASDANMELTEGYGTEYPFALTFEPRNFNGTVFYDVGPIGIGELNAGLSFAMFPNPSTGLITIQGDDINGSYLELIDLSGKVVFTQSGLSTSNNEVDLSILSKGLYMVKITGEKGTSAERLLLD